MASVPIRGLVGIELRRAGCRRRVIVLVPSLRGGFTVPPWLVSGGPPTIPDSRISQGPVRSLGFSSSSLPSFVRFLSADSRTPQLSWFASSLGVVEHRSDMNFTREGGEVTLMLGKGLWVLGGSVVPR
jgi:hypothetical protein